MFLWSLIHQCVQSLEMMVAQNEIERKVLVSAADSVTGSTPLMFAAIENRMQVMERLLSLGCDINKRNKENYTALHFGEDDLERRDLFITYLICSDRQRVCTRGRTQSTGCWPSAPTRASWAGRSSRPASTWPAPGGVVRHPR